MTAKKSAAGAKKIETLSETEAKLWKFRHIRGNDSEDLRYGAIGTPEKYFPQWKEDEADNTRFKLDKYLLKMCRKERLIELLHDFVLFDGGGHPASDLHAFRRPGFWTQAQRELHLATVRQRITTPAILVVARAMIEAVDLTNGFCTISVAELARGLSCSTKTVTKSRAALRKTGLWIAGHRGVFVPVALNCNQAIDNTSRKQRSGNIKVPRLYHLSIVSAPVSLPSPVPATPRTYQADMFGCLVVDLDQYRRGMLPSDFVAANYAGRLRQKGARAKGPAGRDRHSQRGVRAATLTASEAPWLLLSACLRGGEARP